MSAREAVARAIAAVVLDRETGNWDLWTPEADAALAALRPFIAAEIQAWAETRRAPGGELHWLIEELGVPETAAGVAIALNDLTASAEAIAARITTTGEQHE